MREEQSAGGALLAAEPTVDVESTELAVRPAFPAPLVVEVGTPPPALPTTRCANCGNFLIGPFCAQCGQKDTDYHQSIWRLVAEFFDSAFCWDSKVLRTLEPLIKQPGFLTQEFVVGRRARYVHPLRLFLFTSAVCLTLITVGHHYLRVAKVHAITLYSEDKPTKHQKAKAKAAAAASPGAVPSASPSASPEEPSVGADLGRLISASMADEKDDDPKARDKTIEAVGNRIGRKLDQKAKELGTKTAADGARQMTERVSQDVDRRLSWVALAMLPLFALILRAVYWRQESYYFTHLIFSLHYHTFLLMFWLAYTWIGGFADWTQFLPFRILVGLCLLVPPWYLYVALRRLYWEGPALTGIRVVIIGGLHMLALIIGLSIVGSYSYLHP